MEAFDYIDADSFESTIFDHGPQFMEDPPNYGQNCRILVLWMEYAWVNFKSSFLAFPIWLPKQQNPSILKRKAGLMKIFGVGRGLKKF